MTEEAAPGGAVNAPGGALRAVKNSAFGMVEFAWPIVPSVVVTPLLVSALGVSAFGVLSIMAVAIGFLGLLDLGIGGAAVRAIAQHAERRDLESAARVVGTAVTAYFVIGLFGGTALALAVPFLVTQVLGIPSDLQAAASLAFYVSALGFPVTMAIGAFAAVPKALQRFDLSVRVSVPFATISPVVTLFVVRQGFGLPGIAISSLCMNVTAGVIYFLVSRRLLDGAPIRPGIDGALLRGLASFGGWFLVASFGVAILYQLDKLLIGSFLGIAAVTYYVVPGNLANRIQGFMGAATLVVFPVSAAMSARGDMALLSRLYRDGTRLTFILSAMLGVPMAVFAEPFLRYWMGPEFAQHSWVVMVLLVATYVLLGLAGVAWGLAFGMGRARINAMFALLMGAIDVGLFLVLVGPYQLTGAAVAYLASAVIGVPIVIGYVERNVLGFRGWEYLFQYARVLPAIAVQVVLAIALQLIARNLLLTLVAMALSAAALPILYLLLGLATPGDRALLGQVAARLKPRQGRISSEES
jgi:O-antigen/teichoic acid export membrane protein